MVNKKRLIFALGLFLIWISALIISYNLSSETKDQDTVWIIALFSLFLFMIGMVAFFGRIRVFFLLSFPAVVFYSAIDTSKYNVEKASFVLGILTALLSYVLLFMLTGGLISAVALFATVSAFVIGITYVFASKRFRSDVRPNQ